MLCAPAICHTAVCVTHKTVIQMMAALASPRPSPSFFAKMDHWVDRFIPYPSTNAIVRYNTNKRITKFQHTPNGYEKEAPTCALNCDFDRPLITFGPSPRIPHPESEPSPQLQTGNSSL